MGLQSSTGTHIYIYMSIYPGAYIYMYICMYVCTYAYISWVKCVQSLRLSGFRGSPR